MTLQVSTYKILTTGSDGGHKYIETEVIHKGQLRRLTAFFKDKSEEVKIQLGMPLALSGRLQDDGIEYGLLLLDTEILDN
jgi:hypothetical protein